MREQLRGQFRYCSRTGRAFRQPKGARFARVGAQGGFSGSQSFQGLLRPFLWSSPDWSVGGFVRPSIALMYSQTRRALAGCWSSSILTLDQVQRSGVGPVVARRAGGSLAAHRHGHSYFLNWDPLGMPASRCPGQDGSPVVGMCCPVLSTSFKR